MLTCRSSVDLHSSKGFDHPAIFRGVTREWDLVEGAGQIYHKCFHWAIWRKVESTSGAREGCGLLYIAAIISEDSNEAVTTTEHFS